MNASWLSAAVGADAAAVAGVLLAVLAVLAAVWLCLRLLRHAQSRRFGTSGRRGSHRIMVRDSIPLDKRRRLVLIRRDNIEHLLLTGGDSDVVIETFTDQPTEKQLALAAAEARAAIKAESAAKAASASPAQPARAESQPRAENAYMARAQAQRSPPARSVAPAREARPAARPQGSASYAPRTAPQNAEPNGAEAQPRLAPQSAPQPTAPRPVAANPAYAESRQALRANGQEQAAPMRAPNGSAWPQAERGAAAYSPRQTEQAEQSGAAENPPAQSLPGAIRENIARPIIADSYAPYLGYMPQAARPLAPRPAPQNNAAHQPRQEQNSRPAPQNAAHQGNGAHQAQAGSAQNRGNGAVLRNFSTVRGGQAQAAPSNSAREQTAPQAAAPKPQASHAGGFDLSGNAGNFAKVVPPQENDFDKILQDELLRMPNGIKFPSAGNK